MVDASSHSRLITISHIWLIAISQSRFITYRNVSTPFSPWLLQNAISNKILTVDLVLNPTVVASSHENLRDITTLQTDCILGCGLYFFRSSFLDWLPCLFQPDIRWMTKALDPTVWTSTRAWVNGSPNPAVDCDSKIWLWDQQLWWSAGLQPGLRNQYTPTPIAHLSHWSYLSIYDVAAKICFIRCWKNSSMGNITN